MTNILLSVEDVKELFLEAFTKTVQAMDRYAKWSMPPKNLSKTGIIKVFGDGFNNHLRIGSIATSEYLQSTITNGVAELIVVKDKGPDDFIHVLDTIEFLKSNQCTDVVVVKNIAVFACSDGIVKIVTKEYTSEGGKRLILIVDKKSETV